MCGIAGMIVSRGQASPATMDRMCDVLGHRGPDARGTWISPDARVAFGHVRLAIVDLSPSGAQPMSRDGGNLTIVFNGEIYNHAELRVELAARGVQFSGTSDTETILEAYRAWGTECVRRLRGMFAFALYDASTRTVFFARDRAGEKPLFISRNADRLMFASELKALMADPSFSAKLSDEGLYHFLSFGYVPERKCILAGVEKLAPAHCMVYALESGEARVWRYWDLPPASPAPIGDASKLADELDGLLSSSVREQLHADVPVAVLLSGGMDSSLVTAYAASVSTSPVKTFSVGFPGSPAHDERRYARLIASHFGTEHTELTLDDSSIDLMSKLARQFDEPISDSSMIPTYLLSRTVAAHGKVVLGGDGGDELFGGYRAYEGMIKQAKLRRLIPSVLRSVIAAAARRAFKPGTKGRNGLIGLRGDLSDGLVQMGTMFTPDEISRLMPHLGTYRGEMPGSWRRRHVEPERGVPGAAMAMDFRTYMPEDILVKVDRASMLCSLEVRAPMLDYRIIEFAFSKVPNELRVHAGERKRMLRILARRRLPAEFDIDRKQGFTIPLSKWLAPSVIADWKSECETEISALTSGSGIEVREIEQELGTIDRLFAFMMLTRWMREYKVTG